MSAIPMRAKVLALEDVVRGMEQMPLKTGHYFADSMYARELFQPADSVVIGKVHKREHFFIVLSGAIKVVVDEATEIVRAPKVLVSKAGAKRAIYALEDSTYLTVHKTKKKNVDKIEKEIVEEDNRALFDAHNNIKALK